jgi:hypothetical protein
MELTVIATTVALSIGLGLASAHAMLSIVLFFMTRSMVQYDVRLAMSSDRANISRIAVGSIEPFALSVRAA